MSKLVRYDAEISGAVDTAQDVGFDNTKSSLTAINAQDAIDELDGKVDTNTSDISTLETTTSTHTNQISELNTHLSELYNNISIVTYDIPSNVNTVFAKFNDISFGKYLVFGSVMLKTTQPSGGALLRLNTSNNDSYITPVPTGLGFLGNACICGYAEISKASDYINLSYYSNQAVTISSAQLFAIRLK